jgi:hypothetical protein
MEEAGERPPCILMIDNYFVIYKRRRRTLISGKAPPGLTGDRPPQARTWRAFQHRLSQEPAWERAWRYRRMMQAQGALSIRALARAIGEDHSRMARVLKVLELPERVLAALRAHADHARIRVHFTERHLRQLVMEKREEPAILHEIEQILRGRRGGNPVHVRPNLARVLFPHRLLPCQI